MIIPQQLLDPLYTSLIYFSESVVFMAQSILWHLCSRWAAKVLKAHQESQSQHLLVQTHKDDNTDNAVQREAENPVSLFEVAQ